MTREEILAGVKRLEPWFHRIDLGGGLYTKTASVMGEPVDHPHGVWQTIGELLPRDLGGKTLLDVGCNAGFYAFEAKRRGAQRVLGVDGQRFHVRQALFARKLLGVEAEFRRLNVYELSPRTVGRFDITLALGLIYHLKHPILALENLYQVTTDLLVIETAILPPAQAPASFPTSFGSMTAMLHPLAYVENPPDAKEQVFNWFLPGVDALLALLRDTGFHEVRLIQVAGDRAVVVCRKGEGSAPTGEAIKYFVARLALEEASATCRTLSELTFRLRVENIGWVRWPATGAPDTDKGRVYLGAHLLRDTEEEVEWAYGSARLPRDLDPGESASIEIRLTAPAEPGSYVVEFDMVAEHVTWFEDYGSGTLRHALVVKHR